MGFLKHMLQGVKSVPRLYMAIIAGVSAVSVGTASVAGYVSYGYESLPTEVAEVQIIEESVLEEVIVEELEEEPEENIEGFEEEEEGLEEDEIVELSLNTTSIEKDLKVKIQNQLGKVVTGVEFTILLSLESDKKAKKKEYTDKDKDGIIYIDKLEAGNYNIELKEIEGYILKKSTLIAKVKGQIDYKKVDVSDEIKKESQINTAVEDTASNNIPVESTLQNTVDLIPSSVTAAKVSSGDISVPKLVSVAAAVSGQNVKDLKKVVTTQIPGQPVTPTPSPSDPPSPEPTPDPSPSDPPSPDPSSAPLPSDSPGTPSTSAPDTSSPDTTVTTALDVAEGHFTFWEGVRKSYVLQLFSKKTVKGVLTATAGSATPEEQVVGKISLPQSLTLCTSENTEYTLSLSVSDYSADIQDSTIQWKIENESIASITAAGKSVKVTAKQKGETTLTATIQDDTAGVKGTVSCKIVVSDPTISDASAPLKDKSGNQLYLDESGKKPATAADYAENKTFYLAPVYKGWQTIDGCVYYYDANGKAVTGNQVIEGMAYSFSDSGKLSQSSGNRGIDVSKYQGNIDWGAVAASGISFAIIRAGYRGSSTGVLVEDPYFKRNIAGATKAGIKVGVYFFTQAINEAEAIEEASMCLSLTSGYNLTYPIFIDTESATNGRANGLSKSARTAVVSAFCKTIANGGRRAGVYASRSWYINQLNASSLNGYCIWVAQYAAECTYTGKKDMWQYTSSGTVKGISGKVDMNISYIGY